MKGGGDKGVGKTTHDTHLTETALQDVELGVEGAREDKDREEDDLKHPRVHVDPCGDGLLSRRTRGDQCRHLVGNATLKKTNLAPNRTELWIKITTFFGRHMIDTTFQ